MSILMRNKLTPNMLGNPKKIHNIDGDNARLLIGTIYGRAERVRDKMMERDGVQTMYTQILGSFEGVPAEPMTIKDKDGEIDVEAYQSGILYLPPGAQDRLVSLLKREDAQAIEFSLELYVVKANNPAGYTWELRSLIPASADDPLAKLRALTQEAREYPKAIAHDKGGKGKTKASEAEAG